MGDGKEALSISESPVPNTQTSEPGHANTDPLAEQHVPSPHVSPSHQPLPLRRRRRRCCHRERGSVGRRYVESEVLDYLRSGRDMDWAEAMGQSLAASIRRFPEHRQLPLYIALLTVVQIAKDPYSARALFLGIRQFANDGTFPQGPPVPAVWT
ncbi:hypothetical protein GDO78_022939 [Eleutherodactylus coqui]|uniref:Uncharacterized protein n=1 Tax=Eleutherodactylus coqui TaxID=57060 RepID=A0A8J6BMA9_ELECQ|nr:hypothetical protein GDO78_022939 [Eleutherodactylus coqui]